MGYPLAPTQGELTSLQKLFLLRAYPVFNKRQLALSNNNNVDNPKSVDTNFEKRYKSMKEQNRTSFKNGVKS